MHPFPHRKASTPNREQPNKLMEDPNNKISTLFQLLLFFFIQHFKPPTNFWESACYDRGPDGSILAIRLVLSHLIHVY